jgi:hypothetical protein
MYPQQAPDPQQAQYPQPVPAPPPKPPPVVITAQPGSRLTDLLDRRDIARAQQADLTGQVDALTAAIKNEVTEACAGAAVIDIDSPGRKRLRLAWRQGNRVDTAALKREMRHVYDHYLRPGKGYWELRELSGD